MEELSVKRGAEMRAVTERVTRWAQRRGDVVGLLLVGSCARGAAGPESDVDLVLLSSEPAGYAADDGWRGDLALGELVRVRAWGPLTEWRHATGTGLEVELGIAPASWARTDPVDVGTRKVVMDGARVLHDPSGVLADLISECRGGAQPSSVPASLPKSRSGNGGGAATSRP